MKNKTLIFWTVAFAVSLSSTTPSFAGGKENGGGDGVMINSVPYLYDLVEAGVETAPYFDPSSVTEPFILAAVQRKFHNNAKVPVELLARKLSEIWHADRFLGQALIKTIGLYSWAWTRRALSDLPDDGDTVLNPIIKGDLVQLAVRSGRFIYLDDSLWSLMPNNENRVALIVHEANYAVYSGLDSNLVNIYLPSYPPLFRGSKIPRQLTGLMFQADFSINGHELINSSYGDFPVETTVSYELQNKSPELYALNKQNDALLLDHMQLDITVQVEHTYENSVPGWETKEVSTSRHTVDLGTALTSTEIQTKAKEACDLISKIHRFSWRSTLQAINFETRSRSKTLVSTFDANREFAKHSVEAADVKVSKSDSTTMKGCVEAAKKAIEEGLAKLGTDYMSIR